METVSIDVKGPLPGKIKYFLTMKDSFSNYFAAQPMTSVSADSTIKSLQIMFAYLGIPHVIKTDNGTNFKSQKFEDFCRSRNIFLEFSSVDNPQENRVERSHSQLTNLFTDWTQRPGRNRSSKLTLLRVAPWAITRRLICFLPRKDRATQFSKRL